MEFLRRCCQIITQYEFGAVDLQIIVFEFGAVKKGNVFVWCCTFINTTNGVVKKSIFLIGDVNELYGHFFGIITECTNSKRCCF
jgi:hypothetical protein